jgi:hypothetical protein
MAYRHLKGHVAVFLFVSFIAGSQGCMGSISYQKPWRPLRIDPLSSFSTSLASLALSDVLFAAFLPSWKCRILEHSYSEST